MINPLSKAGESVRRRGFLDGDRTDVLIQQLFKLREEVDELEQSYRNGAIDADELADVAIVTAAIANTINVDLDLLVVDKCRRDEHRGIRHQGEPLPSMNGHVWRDFS